MDKFCKFCGSPHAATAYPLTCPSCEKVTWFSPSPVAVLIVPVRGLTGTGVLIGRRAIDPQKGKWNLPAGFVDAADPSIEHAAVRELREETGLIVEPEDVDLISSYGDGRVVLSFCQSRTTFSVDDLHAFVANEECDAIEVAWSPEILCFDSHTEALAKFFQRLQSSNTQ